MPDEITRWEDMDDEELITVCLKQMFDLHREGRLVVLELAPMVVIECVTALLWALKQAKPARNLVGPWRVLELLENSLASLQGQDGPMAELMRREKRLT